MSVQLTSSKRPHDRSVSQANKRRKWQKSGQFTSPNTSSKDSPGSIILRILCPASKIGSIIGKGGSKISQIRQETGVKVKVEDTVAGCEERVVLISGTNKENEVVFEPSKNVDEEIKPNEEINDAEEHADDADKQPLPVEGMPSDKVSSSVQKALLLVFERMAEGESETNGGEDENNTDNEFVVRLLVLTSQASYLSGNAGSKIKQLSSASGAQIQVLPKDELPACALPSDDLVQLSGSMDAVRKALQSVSEQLLESPPGEDDTLSANVSGQPRQFSGNSLSRPEPPSYPFIPRGAPFATGPHDAGNGVFGHMGPSPDVLTFRLICPDEKVGGVIGKGGTIVKGLKQETGCDIKVIDPIPNSEDRIIVISGPVHPDDNFSAAEDAVIRVHTTIVMAAPESKEKTVTAKMIVSSFQIGCLLGKGGSVISEMRKLSGATIRILGRDQTPQYVLEGDEIVQVQGEFEVVQDALLQITSRLRIHFIRDAFPSDHRPPQSAFPDHGPPFPSFARRGELPPPGRYLSFNHFDAFGGPPPHGEFHPHADRLPFMHNDQRPGFPPHISDRMPPPAPWGPQGPMEGMAPGGPVSFHEYPGFHQRRTGGFGGGHQAAIITSTTMEVVVPCSVVSSIIGVDGGCLKEIREISDAKITIKDPKPGATETLIIISGTPEQTHAAQSLIQAFVIIESSEAS